MSQVLIGDILPRTQASAMAGQTLYNANWTANYPSDVVAYSRAANTPANDFTQQLNYPADYSVTFVGSNQDVLVTLTNPSTLGDIVTIIRQTPADRENLYTNTNFTPTMLNNDFGILTLVDQQAQLVDDLVGPRYNYSAIINPLNLNEDTILPILPPNSFWVKNNANNAIVTATLPEGGFAPAAATYLTLTDFTAALPNSLALSNLSAGIMINDPVSSDVITRSITGSANQIAVGNPTGVAGNINIGIASNPIIPGTAGMGIPQGTTAQRVIPTSGIGLRYNTDLEYLEYYDPVAMGWFQLHDSSLAFLPLAGGTMTGAIDMGTNYIHNLHDPTAAQDAATKAYVDASGVTPVQIQNQAFTFQGTDSGAANAYVITFAPPIAAYSNGQDLWFIPAHSNNSGLCQINISGLGNITMYNFGGNALQAGDVQADVPCHIEIYFDGTLYYAYVQNPFNLSYVNAVDIQQDQYNKANDSGTANAYQTILFPTIASLTNGLAVRMTATLNANTGASTLDADGTPRAIVTLQGNALGGGEILLGYNYDFIWDAANSWYVLQNSSLASGGGGITPAQLQDQTYTYFQDTGATDVYVVTCTPPLPSLQDGQKISFKAANANTGSGSETLNVDGLGARSLITNDTDGLLKNAILSGCIYDVEYNTSLGGGSWVLQNGSNIAFSTAVQNRLYTYQFDSGMLNAYALTIYPIPSSQNFGQQFTFIAGTTNTSASTFNLFGQGAVALNYPNGSPLTGGEVVINQATTVSWNWLGSFWQIDNPFNNGFLPLIGGTLFGDITFNGTNYIDNLTGFKDSSGNLILDFNYVASAVNYVTLSNQATGLTPGFNAEGSDTNIGLSFSSKGAGDIVFGSPNGGVIDFSSYSNFILRCIPQTNADVNYFAMYSAPTGQPALFQATGTDTDIDIQFLPKGAGNMQFGNAASFSANASTATVLTSVGPAGAHTTVQEWLKIKNSSGVTRYIPCF